VADVLSGDGAAPDWAAEAQRLLTAFQEAAAAGGHVDHTASAAECRYCPLCQGVAVLRRSAPDVLDRVAELAVGLAASLRASAPEDGPDEVDLTQPRPAPPRPPAFRRIDVTD
jgi:hypothetical protein